ESLTGEGSLEAVYAAIQRNGVNTADHSASEKDAIPCPFRGLRPFREEDGLLFFGRKSCIAELQLACNTHNLIAVVGASGSGKSSVVRAGLLPILRRTRPNSDVIQL